MIYYLASTLAYLVLKLFFRLEEKGKNCIPKKGPFIYACNHESNLDPIVMGGVSPRKVVFLAKEELFKNKIAKFFLLRLSARPLKRQGADIGTLRLALEVLRRDPIVIFPQGTRGADFTNAKDGVGFLCKKAMVPVVVAKITGTDKVWPKGSHWPRLGKISVTFERVDNLDFNAPREAITNQIVAKIKSV